MRGGRADVLRAGPHRDSDPRPRGAALIRGMVVAQRKQLCGYDHSLERSGPCERRPVFRMAFIADLDLSGYRQSPAFGPVASSRVDPAIHDQRRPARFCHRSARWHQHRALAPARSPANGVEGARCPFLAMSRLIGEAAANGRFRSALSLVRLWQARHRWPFPANCARLQACRIDLGSAKLDGPSAMPLLANCIA